MMLGGMKVSPAIKKAIRGEGWPRWAGFLLFFLLAYTWTTPFRDLYGLEIRNALIAREMLDNGVSLLPKVLGHYYPDYMPLYFWLEVLFSLPAGRVGTFSAVLPSALSAVGLLALTLSLGRRIDNRTGWLSALILAVIPSFWRNAGSATIDMLLAFWATAAILCFYCGDAAGDAKRRKAFACGALLSLLAAFMVKGAIGIVLPASSWSGYLLLNRRWKDFFFFGAAMTAVGLLCLGAQFSLAYIAGGRELVGDMIRMQVTGRLRQANKPFFYYFLCLLEIGGLWWGLIVAGLYVPLKDGRLKERRIHFPKRLPPHPVNRLALAWFIGVFLVFSFAATKHSRYLLPLYPPAAILLAALLQHLLVVNNAFRTERPGNIMVFCAMAILCAGIVFYPLSGRFGAVLPPGMMILWLAAGIAGAVLATRWIEPKCRLIASALLLLGISLSGADLLISPALSRHASAHAFTSAAEASVDPRLPVVICGLGRDGDALKYIFYSSRNPRAIRFVDRPEELKALPEPCLLITPLSDVADLPVQRRILRIAKGNIRSKELYAYRLGPEQNKTGASLPFFNPF